jgi:hypothetical protein
LVLVRAPRHLTGQLTLDILSPRQRG